MNEFELPEISKEDEEKLYKIHTCEKFGNNTDEECIPCGIIDCPYKEPLHYHLDGCPACYQDEIKKPWYIIISKNKIKESIIILIGFMVILNMLFSLSYYIVKDFNIVGAFIINIILLTGILFIPIIQKEE